MAERELIYRLKVDSKTGKLELSQFQADLETTTKKAESSASRIRTAFDNTAKSMSEIGKSMSIGITLPLVALGAAALKAGQEFDDAFDSIRVATGATGQELEGLQDSFRKVFENVPDSAEKVSKAIGELNTRLDLSGPPLEALTTQILNLSRLTGEDLNGVIESSTRVFGAWSIATEDQGKTLDYMFKVSQQTGIGVTALLEKAKQFAPVFREMGFSIEESAALLGKWEKAGINAEQVLAGLRIAAKKFSDQGISLKDGLAEIVKQIQALGPGTKTTALAMEYFGKSGLTMADAILKGKLSVDDLVKSLKDSPETINKAAEATAGFAEKFVILKNRLLSALEPLGTLLLDVLERDIIPLLMDAVEVLKTLIKWFSDLPGPVKTAAIGFAAFAAVLGPLLYVMSSVVSWAGNIAATFATMTPKIIAATGATTTMEGAAILLGTALRFVAASVAVVGVAFAAWEIGRMIGEITGLDDALTGLLGSLQNLAEESQAWNVVLNTVTFGLMKADGHSKQLQDTITKLNATLKSPLVKESGESWDQYAAKVQKAAFEQTGIADKLKKTAPEAKKVSEETKKLNVDLNLNSEAAKKAQKEIEGWGDALGLAIPKLKETVANGQKYLDYLKKNKASVEDVEEAEKKLLDAKKKLIDALSPAQAAFRKINDILKDNRTAFERAEAAVKDYKVELVSLRGLLPDVTEMQLDYSNAMATTARDARLLEAAQEALEDAFKSFGLTTEEELTRLADVADAKFRMIRDSGIASPKQILIAQKQAIEAIIRIYEELGQKVPPEFAKMVQSIDKELDKLPKSAKEKSAEMSKEIRQEISTIFNDLEKGIAEAIVHWKGFWETLKTIGQNFAESIVRIFLKNLMEPLTREGGVIDQISSAISRQFSKLADSISGFFQDIFGKIGGFLKNFLSSTAGQITGAIAGVGLAFAGLKAGGTKGLLASIGGGALAGGSIGAMVGGPLAPITAPIGAAVGAAAGGLASLVSKFTRRGKEKLEATQAAEELSRYVWQEVVPNVKAGLVGVEDGEKAIQAAFDAYQQYLKDNLKDQTVIARSIETQRITLTQGLAALEEIKKNAGEVSDDLEKDITEKIDALAKAGMEGINSFLDQIAKTGVVSDDVIQGLQDIADAMKDTGKEAEISASNFAVLGAQFLQTGMMTDDFAAAIEEAGGSMEFFNKATAQIQGLQGLRAEFANLKQAIDALLPKQKTWQEEFLDTGVITDDMAKKIQKAGGDINDFRKFADMKNVRDEFDSLVAEFNKTGVASDRLLELIMQFGGPDSVASFKKLMDQAKASGKTIGDLAKDSEDSTKVIQGAFDSTADGINKAFTDAAKTLSDTLQEMDDNLGKAIASLQAAMVTMIKDLIDVLLDIPGAAEKAATDANFFLEGIKDQDVTVTVNLDTSFAERQAQGIKDLLASGFVPLEPLPGDPVGMPGYTPPSFQAGTPYVPKTGLAMLHQGERVIPASKNRGGSGETSIDQTINFYNVNDPNEQYRMMQRINRETLNQLRRQ